MKITGKDVAPGAMRYKTVGDWQASDELLEVQVLHTEDWRASAALFLHEYIEAMLCRSAGISTDQVDAWDTGPGAKQSTEPGDAPNCPYREHHRFAENLERLFVAQLGLTWREHEEEIERASKGP